MHAVTRVSGARVAGWSVSWRDAAAVAVAVGGALVAIAGAPVGQLVYVPSGSLVLGVGVTVAVMLGGFLGVVGGMAYLLGTKRTYRHRDAESVL